MTAARAACGAALAAALGGALGTPRPAAGQVTALRPLSFGTVVTGVPTTVGPASANAAAWRVRGVLGVSGGVDLTLPAVLTRAGGGATMPVTFCATCAAYRLNNASPVGAVAFDPRVGVHGLTVVVLSDIYIWLGGTVAPAAGQAPGQYVGTAVLTISALL